MDPNGFFEDMNMFLSSIWQCESRRIDSIYVVEHLGVTVND